MTIAIETVERLLSAEIHENLLQRKTPLARDADLFDAGFDSFCLTRILVFVDERLGLLIPDEDVDVEQISTIEKMSRFVHDRLGAAGL